MIICPLRPVPSWERCSGDWNEEADRGGPDHIGVRRRGFRLYSICNVHAVGASHWRVFVKAK
jgi:hypothetical protein